MIAALLRRWLPLCLLVAAVPAIADEPAAVADEPADGDFVPMFNGEDLTGWKRINTAPSTWSFEDGLLVCSGKPIGELRTERMYQNFVMELEWRHMVPKGNAGVFVWADDITAKGVPFHRGIEVQVLENDYGNNESHTTHGDIFPIHGATMTPVNGRGGSRAFPTEFRSKPSPEWNHYRIECQDGAISLAVNGAVVTRGTDCVPRKGYICLESEGGVVHYRNVRIKELPETPIEPEHVAVADRGYRSLYNGVDLDGWKTSDAAAEAWQSRDWELHFDGKEGGDAAALATEETFGDVGFVLDVKLNENSGVPRVNLRGAEFAIDASEQGLSEALGRPGRWNRFEGTLAGKDLVLSLNGREVLRRTVDDAEAKGPLRLVPAGPVEFANVYVRELSSDEP